MGYNVEDLYREIKYNIPKRKSTIKSSLRQLAKRIASDIGKEFIDREAFVHTSYYYLRVATHVKDIDYDEVRYYIDNMFEEVHGQIHADCNGIYKKTSSWTILYLAWLYLDTNMLYNIHEITEIFSNDLEADYHSIGVRLHWLNTKGAIVKVKDKKVVYWGLPTVTIDLDEKCEKVEGQLIYICR